MAQGIKHGIFSTFFRSVPKMKGNEVANEGADCTAGKPNSAMLLESLKPNVPLIWFNVVRFPSSRTLAENAAAKPPSRKSVSAKMKVFLMSNPTAIMSIAFWRAKRRQSAKESLALWKNFSSSVSMMMRGTSNTSCRYFVNSKGIV